MALSPGATKRDRTGERASRRRFFRLCEGLVMVSLTCVGACAGEPDTLEQIHERGFVRAGYSEEPPYAFMGPDGRVGGESPEALRGALPAIGVDSVRWIRLDFESLVPQLAAGRLDVIASGLFITEGRSASVTFSRPTACASPALLTREGTEAPEGIQAFALPEGPRLAVLDGSVELEAARFVGVGPDRLLVVPDMHTGAVAVRRGDASALALTFPTAVTVASGMPDLRATSYDPPAEVGHLVSGCSGIAFRKGDRALAEALNRGLDDFIGTPSHLAILEPLGFSVQPVLGAEAGGQ